MISTDPTVFASRLDIPPPPPECLNSPDALRAWLNRSTVTTQAGGVIFGYTVGTIASATAEDRDKPRFIFDVEGRYLGLAVWVPSLQGWTIGGQIGQLMTLVKISGGTAQSDLDARPMRGWRFADGGTTGIPNLRPESGNNTFFTGTQGEWSVYTVAYTG